MELPARQVVFGCGLLLAMSAPTSYGGEDLAVPLTLCCAPDNDLWRVLTQCKVPAQRKPTLAEAIGGASAGSGLLVLADGYPTRPTPFDSAAWLAAQQKNLCVFLEFPSWLPSGALGPIRQAKWERAVVASDAFTGLPRLRILAIHDCHFLPLPANHPHLVLARVAGLDTAVFGLPDQPQPLLVEPAPRLLVAGSKLSQFVTGRYGPQDAWRAVWSMILGRLMPGQPAVRLDWVPTIRPTYARDARLPDDATVRAIVRGVDWHSRARLLVHPDWRSLYDQYGHRYPPVGPRPADGLPVGDGEQGLLEGFTSRIRYDGAQDIRWWLRSDCNGESGLAFALRWRLDGDRRSRQIAENLVDWVYRKSEFFHDNPARAAYGLLGWAPSHLGTYYGDNDVKAILGCMGTGALVDTDRWDERLLLNILANFRTTGRLGFRGACLDDRQLEKLGWRHYWEASTVHYAPHYEAWIWACYLWLYDKTRFEPLLKRTREGLRAMMDAYPARWRWTNGIQQERARMLLPLAWLLRVDDSAEHRDWLRRIADDLLADQQPCGAFQEEIGDVRLGTMRPPQSNAEYGTHEASLIQENGDPIADSLYTNNFALLGLIEAAAVTKEPRLAQAADRLAAFFVRVQARSELRPELDGAWFRAVDMRRWEYWASNSDWEWGPWCTEVGWTQGWILSGLAMNRLKLNLWDLTAKSRIGRHMAKHRPVMLPEDVLGKAP